MHVVIVGCGRVGSSPAGLTASVTRWRSSIGGRRRSAGSMRFTGRTIAGVGFDRDRLLEAGIDEADALAAVTNGDNSNILVARVAREAFGVERVVARIYDPRRQLCTSGWVSRRSPLWRGRPARPAPTAPRHERGRVGRPEREGHAHRAPGRAVVGGIHSEMEDPGAVRVMAVSRLGVAQVPGLDLVAQEGDIAYLAVGAEVLELDGARLSTPKEGAHR